MTTHKIIVITLSGDNEYNSCKACATYCCEHADVGSVIGYPAIDLKASCELCYEGICNDR